MFAGSEPRAIHSILWSCFRFDGFGNGGGYSDYGVAKPFQFFDGAGIL